MRDFILQMSETFKALGDPTRLKILRMVTTRGNNFYVAEIAEKIGISTSAVSQHLKVLRTAGIVEAGEDLRLESQMPDGGVIFSDGMEADALAFNSGSVAIVRKAAKETRLVANAKRRTRAKSRR